MKSTSFCCGEGDARRIAVPGGRRRFADAVRPAGDRGELAEQARELAPLGVLAAAAHAEREAFERLQGFELRLQLHDGAGRRRLIEDARLGVLDLLFRYVVEVRDVVGVELRSSEREGGNLLVAALEHFELA